MQGTVEGVGQLFGNIGHSLFGKPSTQEEGAAKAVLGVGVAKRKFAEKFAVDPYSSNEPMQARLGELAWAATAGSMTVGGAFGAIGGPASGVLRATKFAGGAGTLIYDKSPDQLKNINRANLAHMGMSPELTAAFLDHPKYSPTRKTIIVAVIGRMNGISNRRLLLQDAVTATAEPDTFLWQRQVELIAGYHLKVGPVDRLVNLGIRPAMVTKTGTLIVAVPSDYFAWTETMEREAQEIRGSVGKSLTGIKRREAWFSGQISPFARAKLEARGWIVKDNTAVRLAL